MNAVVTVAAKGIRKGSNVRRRAQAQAQGRQELHAPGQRARGTATLTKAGAGTLALPKKGLGKGRYTAMLTAVDTAGNQSKATVTFTIR